MEIIAHVTDLIQIVESNPPRRLAVYAEEPFYIDFGFDDEQNERIYLSVEYECHHGSLLELKGDNTLSEVKTEGVDMIIYSLPFDDIDISKIKFRLIMPHSVYDLSFLEYDGVEYKGILQSSNNLENN